MITHSSESTIFPEQGIDKLRHRWPLPVFLLLLPLLLSACGDNNRTHFVSGYAINGPLDGATIEFLNAQGEHLTTVETDPDGGFEAQLFAAPPYRLVVSGGTLYGIPYQGVLESWCEANECAATPWSTVVVRLMEQYGFNSGDARAQLASIAGFDYDPFVHELLTGQPVPAHEFELDAVRIGLDHGTGLAAWVDGVVGWVGGEDCRIPDNLGPPSAPACGAPPEEEVAQSPGGGWNDDVDPEVLAIADAIVSHLATRPESADTVEGIARWWLPNKRYENSIELVQQALDYLEQRGCVIKFMAASTPLYRKGYC